MSPFTAEISQDRGELLIVERAAEGRHVPGVHATEHRDRAADAVQRDPDRTLGRTEQPLGIEERGRETFEPATVQLVTRGADVREQPLARLKAFLLRRRERLRLRDRRDSRLAGPDDDVGQLCEPRLGGGIFFQFRPTGRLLRYGQGATRTADRTPSS